MARPSSESLSIAAVSIPTRAEPPDHLTDFQKKLWRDVTLTKPPEWFEADTFPLLESYCRACETCRELSKRIEAIDFENEKPGDATKWLSAYDQQAKLAATLAVKMRLTQQSRYTPKVSARENGKVTGGVKPWM